MPAGRRTPGDPFAEARARLNARLAAERAARVPEGHGLPLLDDIVVGVAELSPLPQVAMRVLELGESDRFSAHELASVIASDQALTARILRLANSAYYGYARRIHTVRDAVVLIGFRAIRSATLASCLMQAMGRSPNIRHEAFWQFSVATGMLAELLARTERAPHDHAFTAGVMHRIGLLALDQHRPDLLRRALDTAGERGIGLVEAERSALGFTHAELGAGLGRHWNLPDDLTMAIAAQDRGMDAPPEAGSLGAIVMRARIFARASGIPDGLEASPPAPAAAAEDWLLPPLSLALQETGGVEAIVQRADAFLAAALT
jgi:HD-like signal output (HDOD) protein